MKLQDKNSGKHQPFEYDPTGEKMQTMTEMLIEWHTKAKVPILTVPQFPKRDRVNLRLELIREEVKELNLAVFDQDIVEVADALADLLYVTIGAALEFGIPIDKVFAEVHRSNMTKCVDGKVIYREDGKVLKPDTYEPPQLKEILFPNENY